MAHLVKPALETLSRGHTITRRIESSTEQNSFLVLRPAGSRHIGSPEAHAVAVGTTPAHTFAKE